MDDADDDAVPVALVSADAAVELLAAEADVFADVTAVDAALALEVVEPVLAAVEVAAPVVAEQPAALGREVMPAPAQSSSANWMVARDHQYWGMMGMVVATYSAGRRRHRQLQRSRRRR